MAPKRTFVDADTQTDVLFLVHSETQTTPLLATVVDIQTAPTPPLIDRMTETGHQNLIYIIEREWEAQLDRRDFICTMGIRLLQMRSPMWICHNWTTCTNDYLRTKKKPKSTNGGKKL
jgi:hypothetical protein